MKQTLKNFIVPFLSCSPVSTIAERLVTPGIPVFMFHRFNSPENAVCGHDLEHLEKCLRYLKKNNYNFITIEQLITAIREKKTLPKRSVAFTIDDGFLDHATVAAPIFIKHQCRVTIFLISGLLDGELWPWDDKVAYIINNTRLSDIQIELAERSEHYQINDDASRNLAISSIQNWLKTLDATDIDSHIDIISGACDVPLPIEPPGNYQAMSWQQARELEQEGVYFAPHTRTHRILSRLNSSDATNEVVHSWTRLQDELVSPSPVFCYPTGRHQDYTSRDIEAIRQSGLIGAVATEPSFVNPESDDPDYLYKLPRFGFPNNYLDFVQYSSWIERAK